MPRVTTNEGTWSLTVMSPLTSPTTGTGRERGRDGDEHPEVRQEQGRSEAATTG